MSTEPMILEVAMEIAFPHDFLEGIAKKFNAQTARECAMSTSVGGIGPLLKERIIDQSVGGLNVVGVTLLYESVWVQAWHEWGQINLQKKGVGKILREVLSPTDFKFPLTFFDGQIVEVEVWKLGYGQATVYFLAAPSITNVVYPGPKDAPAGSPNPHAWAHEWRLKQSWLVGRGALELAQKLGAKPGIVVLSETPTIFGHNRLVMDNLQNNSFFSATKYIFNDHTPLEYAHPIWDQETAKTVLLDPSFYLSKPAWNPHKKTVDVTSLLVGTCDIVFGVAKKHAGVMKAMASLKEFAPKIQYVTNGVRKEDWQAPELRDADSLSDEKLLEEKMKRKKILLDWAWRHCRLWPTWAHESQDKKIIAWTRRITPYKRLDLLVRMLKNQEYRKRFLNLNQIIFVGGRIHQQDNHAQDIVYDLLDILEKDNDLQQHVIMLDNFNIWEAPILYQGVDAAIMLADDTREASATGFMKALMNGAAIIATDDGAVPEFVHFDSSSSPTNSVNGFFIPYVNGEPTTLGLLEALESFDKASRDAGSHAALMRAALKTTEDVSVHRTVENMKQLYGQALNETSVATTG